MKKGLEGDPKNVETFQVYTNTHQDLRSTHLILKEEDTAQKRGRDFPVFLLIKTV